MSARSRIAAALAASVLLAACSGGGGKTLTNLVPLPGNAGALAPVQKLAIAGVGDSLTAGVQSGGMMGADLPVLGVNPQLGQIGPVQRTQEHGFFALLWEQANGVDVNTLSDPTKSPLPLITPPGVGGLLAPTTSGFPFPVTTECDAKQLPANTFSTALSLRENAGLNPYDVGIPGQTVHEALFMTGALGDCTINPLDAPANFVALNGLVNGESQNFWPVLAGFGRGVTQVDAAVSLHAQVATVYLGSNDLLKVAFSGGQAPVSAPQSIHDDTKAIIQKLQGSGAKVAVANLTDVMGAATFIAQPAYGPTLQGYITFLLVQQGVPPAQAAALAAPYATGVRGARDRPGRARHQRLLHDQRAVLDPADGGRADRRPPAAAGAATRLRRLHRRPRRGQRQGAQLGVQHRDRRGGERNRRGIGRHLRRVQTSRGQRRLAGRAGLLLGGLPRRPVQPRRAASVQHRIRGARERVHRRAQCKIHPRHPRRQCRRGVRDRSVCAGERGFRVQRPPATEMKHRSILSPLVLALGVGLLGAAPEAAATAFLETWAKTPSYTTDIKVHETKGSDVQDRTYHYAYLKPHFAKIDVTGGPGRGGGVTWDGGDTVSGHQGGLLSGIHLKVSIHDARAVSLRGDTIDSGSFQNMADAIKAAPSETVSEETVNGVRSRRDRDPVHGRVRRDQARHRAVARRRISRCGA